MTPTLMIIFNDMRLGGVQRKIIDIISYYQQNFPSTKIVLCLREKKGIFLRQVPKNVQVIGPTFFTRRFNMTWFTLWLIGKMSKIRPTQIVSFMDLGSVPTIICLKLLPWIRPQLTIGEDILTSQYVYTESFPFIRKILIRHLYPTAANILVQTPIQKRDLENIIYRGTPNPKIIASPNWLPLAFPPKTIPPLESRKFDILYVGRLDHQKNLPLFVRIIDLVRQTHPNIMVAIVGSGSQKSAIQKLIRSYSLQHQITIYPPTLDTIPYYTSAKIFLLTSDYEGFPLTLIEAISSGCIPITRDIPEVSQFFNKNKSKIIFNTPAQASKLIINTLKQPNSDYLQPYLEIIIKNQKKDISAFIQHFSRP